VKLSGELKTIGMAAKEGIEAAAKVNELLFKNILIYIYVHFTFPTHLKQQSNFKTKVWQK